MRVLYPFSAVVGQDRLRLACTLLAVDPSLGGLLICGEKGTAKSTAARGLADLLGPQAPFVDLPLSVTEDRLLGSLELESALQGRHRFEEGLLSEAHGGILYVDEVNLLAQHLTNNLLDVASSGVLQVQREGFAHRQDCSFLLIGSMNPEEGELRAQLLDRFGLALSVEGLAGREERKLIVERRLAFERDPHAFRERFAEESLALSAQLQGARDRLSAVKVPDRILEEAVQLALAAGVQGHRADFLLLKAATALAALKGGPELTADELQQVAELVLWHRRTEVPEAPPQSAPPQPPSESSQNPSQKQPSQAPDLDSQEQPDEDPTEDPQDNTEDQAEVAPRQAPQELLAPTDPFQVRDWLPSSPFSRASSGRGAKGKRVTRRGQRVGTLPPSLTHLSLELALASTLRAACLRSGKALPLQSSDLRFKKRRCKTGATVLFLLDASGSMASGRRMAATKGAVLSLLLESYRRRDTVGLAVFAGDRVEMALPPTRSVDQARRLLTDLPTGGRSPLGRGLLLVHQELARYRRRDPGSQQILVIVSDGRANLACDPSLEPFEEALQKARDLAMYQVPTLALDTEEGPVTLGMLKRIAQELRARYRPLGELPAAQITELVKDTRRRIHEK